MAQIAELETREKGKRKLVTKTRSICPECNRILEADVVEEEQRIKIYKTCPKHGEFDDLYFGDADMYYRFAQWLHDGKGTGNPNVEVPRCACPANCGLCSSHLSHTGLSNLVITNRCDLHCWYCLPPDEEIVVMGRDGVRLRSLGDLAEEHFRGKLPTPAGEGEYVKPTGIKVIAHDASRRTSWTKVEKIFRRKYSGRILRITTKTGKTVRVTEDHMMLVYGEGGLTRVKAASLKAGDRLLTIYRFPLSSEEEVKEVNVLRQLSKLETRVKEKIFVRNLAGAIDKGRILEEDAGKVYRWLYRDSIPLSAIDSTTLPPVSAGLGLDATDYEIPSILTLTPQLLELMGYFVADGHYTYKDLRITAKDDFVKRRIISAVEELGVPCSILQLDRYGKANQIVIGSRLMRVIFLHVFGIPERAANKRLPVYALALPQHLRVALLTGLINGDGYVVKGQKHVSMGIATVSRGLARDITLLLASLGIPCRVYRVSQSKMKRARNDLYKIYISSNAMENLLTHVRDLRPSHMRKLAGISPRRALGISTVGDFLLDEVKQIDSSYVDGETVYDLEVSSDAHAFVCGDGVLVSNCFFYAEKAGYIYEPSLEQLREMAKTLKSERPVPGNSVQITGGEPALRDDLPEIISILREEGVDHIQLNTNGIRLGREFEFFKRVKEAGLSNLYMSFDGVTAKTNPKNHWEVPGVLENARKLGVGIVLVPTVIKSINDHELGDMIRFGFRNIDVVRSVNFQPVSLTGRMPKKEREKYRITIPDCIIRIEEQTDGEVPRDAWFPVPACTPLTHFIEALTRRTQYELSIHFACGAGTYVFKDGDRLVPITDFVDIEGLLKYLQDKAEEIEAGVNRWWVAVKVLFNLGKFINEKKQPTGMNLKRMLFEIMVKHNYSSVGQWHLRSMFLGMMHFMDKYNHDEERLRRCDIHYLTPDMRIIPFCSFNVIPEWYRDRIQAQYGIPIEEWERRTGRKLKDDFYKRQLPTKRTVVPVASTKTSGFGGMPKTLPVIHSGSAESTSGSCCSH